MRTSQHLEGYRRSAHRAAHPQLALGEASRRCGDRRFRPRRTLALHRAKARLLRPRILEVQGLLVQGMLVQGRVSMLPGRVGMLPTGGTAMLLRNRTTGQRRLALKDRSVKEHLQHIECRLAQVFEPALHVVTADTWRRLQTGCYYERYTTLARM